MKDVNLGKDNINNTIPKITVDIKNTAIKIIKTISFLDKFLKISNICISPFFILIIL